MNIKDDYDRRLFLAIKIKRIPLMSRRKTTITRISKNKTTIRGKRYGSI